MTKQTGYLWAVIQRYLDSTWNPPSQNKLAKRLEVSPSALGDYKFAEHMPSAGFLYRLADEIQVPYEVVLDATLKDHGYRRSDRDEVMGNAVHPAPNTELDEKRIERIADAAVNTDAVKRAAARTTRRKTSREKSEPASHEEPDSLHEESELTPEGESGDSSGASA